MRTSLIWLGLLAACDHPDAPSTTPRPPLSNLTAQIEAANQRMHARFGAARQLEYAIARSDLASARANAHVIAQLDEPDLARSWQPYLIDVRSAARQIEIAGDSMLGSCAHCHAILRDR